YAYGFHAVWTNAAGELCRRPKQAIDRQLGYLARRRGVPPVWIPVGKDRFRAVPAARVSHGKAAEYQARGAVHFHALLRLDGIDPHDWDAIVPPPPQLTAADLEDAARQAAATIGFTTRPSEDQPDGWLIAWGAQVDARVVTLRGTDPVTDAMVAGYLAKYSTKGTEATGHVSARLTDATIGQHANADGGHTERLIHACWNLGKADGLMFGKAHRWDSLRQWAHMLGFGGHFLTKGRHYSVT